MLLLRKAIFVLDRKWINFHSSLHCLYLTKGKSKEIFCLILCDRILHASVPIAGTATETEHLTGRCHRLTAS